MRSFASFLLASLYILNAESGRVTDQYIKASKASFLISNLLVGSRAYHMNSVKSESYTTRLIAEYQIGKSQFFPRHYKGNAEFPDVLGICRNNFYMYSRVNHKILVVDLTTGKTSVDATLNDLIQKGEHNYGGVISLNSIGNTIYIHCAKAVIVYDQLNSRVQGVATVGFSILSVFPLQDNSFFALSTDTAVHFSATGEVMSRHRTRIDTFDHTAFADNVFYTGRIYDLSVSTFPSTPMDKVRTKFIDNSSKGADHQEIVSATLTYLVVHDRQNFGKLLLLNRATLKLAHTIYFKPAGLNESTLLEPSDDPRGGLRVLAQNDKSIYVVSLKKPGVIQLHQISL